MVTVYMPDELVDHGTEVLVRYARYLEAFDAHHDCPWWMPLAKAWLKRRERARWRDYKRWSGIV